MATGGSKRFVPRGRAAPNDSRAAAETVHVFEREIDAIVHDRTLGAIEVVQHQARPIRGSIELTVTIDRPGGADLALCERIAARLNASVGALGTPYTLAVESAGLERPLLRPADYERFAGERVRIVTSLTVNGGKTHRGVLGGLRGETVVVRTERGELLLPAAAIKSANLEYDVRIDLQRDKRERKQSHGNDRKHGN